MAVPLDAIRAIHNAFRKDMSQIDEAAHLAARGKDSLEMVLKRYTFFNEVLVWHASGEEDSVFPALEKVAPLVAEAYEMDHRGLASCFGSLDKAVKASDALAVTRAAVAFNFFLHHHLESEEAHLYRIFNERVPIPAQTDIVVRMSQKIPQARFPQVVAWLFPLIGPDDRENMVRVWQKVLPSPVFGMVTKLIQSAIGDGWAELTLRIPELK